MLGDWCAHPCWPRTGWYGWEKSLRFIPSLFFYFLTLRGSGAVAPSWGVPAGTPSAGEVPGCPPWDPLQKHLVGGSKRVNHRPGPLHLLPPPPPPPQLSRSQTRTAAAQPERCRGPRWSLPLGKQERCQASQRGPCRGAGRGDTQRCHLFCRWPGWPRGSRGGGGRARLPFVPLPLQSRAIRLHERNRPFCERILPSGRRESQ